MGDFSEHVLFGFLSVTVLGYVFSDVISIGFLESLSVMMMVFAGSVFPDIDHENSYVHRSVRAFLSIASGAAVLVVNPLKPSYSFVLALAVFLTVFKLFSYLRPRHRGFLHSGRFVLYSTACVLSVSVLLFSTVLPGLAFAIGILSHLALDGELF